MDPWGGRFDGHAKIADIRSRESEITVDRPAADSDHAEEHGPKVRAAGRIVLMRHTGKLIFLNIRDWTGEIQLFVGKKQVGDETGRSPNASTWATSSASTASCGARRPASCRSSPSELHFLTKSLAPPPEKHHGLTDPELRQRMRYLDLTYSEGVLRAVPEPHEDRAVDPQHARPAAASSRSKARRCTRSPAAPRPGRSRRITTRSTSSCSCGSPWSCT